MLLAKIQNWFRYARRYPKNSGGVQQPILVLLSDVKSGNPVPLSLCTRLDHTVVLLMH